MTSDIRLASCDVNTSTTSSSSINRSSINSSSSGCSCGGGNDNPPPIEGAGERGIIPSEEESGTTTHPIARLTHFCSFEDDPGNNFSSVPRELSVEVHRKSIARACPPSDGFQFAGDGLTLEQKILQLRFAGERVDETVGVARTDAAERRRSIQRMAEETALLRRRALLRTVGGLHLQLNRQSIRLRGTLTHLARTHR